MKTHHGHGYSKPVIEPYLEVDPQTSRYKAGQRLQLNAFFTGTRDNDMELVLLRPVWCEQIDTPGPGAEMWVSDEEIVMVDLEMTGEAESIKDIAERWDAGNT